MGDIRELGAIVAGAFAQPGQAGHGEYLPLVGDFMSFNEIVNVLNRQGHNSSFTQVPTDVFATLFPGAPEIAATLRYFEAYTYLGSESGDRIALAHKVAGANRPSSRPGLWQISRFGHVLAFHGSGASSYAAGRALCRTSLFQRYIVPVTFIYAGVRLPANWRGSH